MLYILSFWSGSKGLSASFSKKVYDNILYNPLKPDSQRIASQYSEKLCIKKQPLQY